MTIPPGEFVKKLFEKRGYAGLLPQWVIEAFLQKIPEKDIKFRIYNELSEVEGEYHCATGLYPPENLKIFFVECIFEEYREIYRRQQ